MNPIKILLVDDSKSARYALRLQIQRQGAAVETEESAEAALKRIADNPPDVVFMDHTMPGMNGFEALDILKADPKTAHIPVVICTSHEDPEFVEQAHEKGAADILSKSLAADKLPALLENLEQQLGGAPAEAAPSAAEAEPAAAPATADLAATVRRESERFVNDWTGSDAFAERVRTLATPMVEKLGTQLRASFAQTEEKLLALSQGDRMQEIIRPLVASLLEELGDSLVGDITARANQEIRQRLETEVESLKQQAGQAQKEQTRVATDQLVSDVLPDLVQEAVDQQRPKIIADLEPAVGRYASKLVEGTAFTSRLGEVIEGSLIKNIGDMAKRKAREAAEASATERANEAAERIKAELGKRITVAYVIAALAGVVAATALALNFVL